MNASDVESLVRNLSSGTLTRDPNAPKIEGPKFVPRIVQSPTVRETVTGNLKFQKWQINTAERFGIDIVGVRKMRSFLQDRRYHRRKSLRA